jgi:hypothetical protein
VKRHKLKNRRGHDQEHYDHVTPRLDIGSKRHERLAVKSDGPVEIGEVHLAIRLSDGA